MEIHSFPVNNIGDHTIKVDAYRIYTEFKQ